MAYAALVSLENIINHHLFSISLQQNQQISSLLEHVKLFQDFLEEFPDKFNSLEGRIRELAEEAEDSFEYLVLAKVRSSSTIRHRIKLKRVMRKIRLISAEIKISSSSKNVQVEVRSWPKQLKSKMIDTKFYSFCKNLWHQPTLALEDVPPGVQGGVDSSIGSTSSNPSGPPKIEYAMVDFEDYVLHVKERLCGDESKLQVIPICGMGGIGKTTLAKTVYDDPLIVETFDIRVWITVSQDYSRESILSSILNSLKKFNTGRLGKTDEEKVYKILKCRRYLVVMDDIWSVEAWDLVRMVFPDDGNGSRLLLTTRLSDVASYPDSSSKLCEMHLMDANQSWILFKKKVFGDEDCPSELANIGKEIARSCKGLPLAVVVIAGVISTVNRNLSSWKEIAENAKKSADQNQIENILALSYFHLPQYLRPCFLYMGSFPEDEEINATKLIRLWVSEGFLKSPANPDSFETVAEECLEELVKRNLVLVTKKKWDGRIKSCGLHDLMRDLCIRKAHKSMFSLELTEEFKTKKKNIRRASIRYFDIPSLLRFSSTTIHSIRCQYHNEYLDSCIGSFRLLRVLDAEHVKVIYSPLHELFHLRYLAVSYSYIGLRGIYNLQNLQTLIIYYSRTMDLDGIGAGELWLTWGLPQLRHVYFGGVIYFCDHEETTCSLGSLQTVSYMSNSSCTERILKKIPNLKKLKLKCFGDGGTTCLNDLVHLHRLESMEVSVRRRVSRRRDRNNRSLENDNLNYPKMLKKLVLWNFVLPWNEIVVVGPLPYLQVLKLKGCHCTGGTWETTEGEFPQLEFLLIEASNLENWITESSHFPRLKRLLLHSCSHLKEIPNDIGEIPTLELIEVNGYAKKSLVKSAEEIQNEQEDLGNNTLQVICKHEITSDDGEDGGDDNDNNDGAEEPVHADEVKEDLTYENDEGDIDAEQRLD